MDLREWILVTDNDKQHCLRDVTQCMDSSICGCPRALRYSTQSNTASGSSLTTSGRAKRLCQWQYSRPRHYRGTADQAQNGRRPGCELHGFNRQGQNTKNAAKFHTSVMCDGSHRPRRQRRRIQASNAGVEGTKRDNQYIIGHLARNSVATQGGILDPNGRCCF